MYGLVIFVMIFFMIHFYFLNRKLEKVEKKVDEVKELMYIMGEKVGMDKKDLNLSTFIR